MKSPCGPQCSLSTYNDIWVFICSFACDYTTMLDWKLYASKAHISTIITSVLFTWPITSNQ